MSEAHRVEVALLGQTLTLRTEASAEYVQALARVVEERVEAMHRGGIADFTRALLLAALDLADELHRAREERTRTEDDVVTRLGVLAALLEGATPPAP